MSAEILAFLKSRLDPKPPVSEEKSPNSPPPKKDRERYLKLYKEFMRVMLENKE